AGLTFSVGDGTADKALTFTGSLAGVNTALASLVDVVTSSSQDFPGPDSITVTVDDQGNYGAGGTQSVSQVITLNPATDTALLQADPLAPTKDLAIYGTAGDDVIVVTPLGASTTKLTVTINGVMKGSFATTGRVLVFGEDGNDTVTISPRVVKR